MITSNKHSVVKKLNSALLILHLELPLSEINVLSTVNLWNWTSGL